MRFNETSKEAKLRSLIKNLVREEISEARARTGVGGRRSAEEKGEVYGVANPDSRYGGDMLAVDVVRRGEDIEIERILGYESGKPVAIDNARSREMIKRQIKNGEAEKLDVPFMART